MSSMLPKPEGAQELFCIFSEPSENTKETKIGIVVHPQAPPQMLKEVIEFALKQIQNAQPQPVAGQAPPKYPTLTYLIQN